MRKRLVILGGSVLIVAAIAVAVYYQQRRAIGEGYDIKCAQPTVPASAPAELTCKVQPSQNTEQGHSSWDWLYVLVAWPEGITAWLLLLTLGAIAWQAQVTNKAANAALAQVQLTIEKERARLYVEPGTLTALHDKGTVDWALRVQLEVENAGHSRAYGIGGEVEVRGCMWIQAKSGPITSPPLKFPWHGYAKYISEGVIAGSLDSQIILVTPETIEQALYGDQAIFLQGWVEYETVGKRFRRRFGYRWWTGSFDRTGLNFGSKFIEGRWLEDDEQDNSETEIL